MKKWKELLADLENNPDPARTKRIMRSLYGSPSSAILVEPLLTKSRTFTSQRIYEGIRSYQPLASEQRTKGMHPTADTYAEITECGGKQLCSFAK